MLAFKWFYSLGWSLQVAVGLILFGVAAVLEAIVLSAYLESLWLGIALAAGLEGAKGLTLVLYRILNGHAGVPYPRGLRWVTLGFRAMLFGLSAACSVMFLAQHLDRPAMERVRAADLAAAETRYRQDLADAQAGYIERRDRTLARLAGEDAREREALTQRYLPAIAALEAKLDAEMDNVVGGNSRASATRSCRRGSRRRRVPTPRPSPAWSAQPPPGRATRSTAWRPSAATVRRTSRRAMPAKPPPSATPTTRAMRASSTPWPARSSACWRPFSSASRAPCSSSSSSPCSSA